MFPEHKKILPFAFTVIGAIVGYLIASKRRSSKNLEKILLAKQLEKCERVTKDDIITFLNEKLCQYPETYKRAFEKVNGNATSGDKTFRVMQWNVLAKGLCSEDECAFSKNTPVETYDWFKYRKWRLIEELMRYDSDLICAEEFDAYEQIKPFLEPIGYSSIFMPKYSSPCLEMKDNIGPDGCAIFYKKYKFQMHNMRCENIRLNNSNNGQVFIVLKLKHLATNRFVNVVCLHLKAKPQNHETRAQQILFILDAVKKHLDLNDKKLDEPLIVCGDFNGEPFEKFYENVLKDPSLNLKNSYSQCVDSDGKLLPSTFKVRENVGLVARTIDYIFYSNLTQRSFLRLPSLTELDPKVGLPNLKFSSDHFSLVCDFELN